MRGGDRRIEAKGLWPRHGRSWPVGRSINEASTECRGTTYEDFPDDSASRVEEQRQSLANGPCGGACRVPDDPAPAGAGQPWTVEGRPAAAYHGSRSAGAAGATSSAGARPRTASRAAASSDTAIPADNAEAGSGCCSEPARCGDAVWVCGPSRTSGQLHELWRPGRWTTRHDVGSPGRRVRPQPHSD